MKLNVSPEMIATLTALGVQIPQDPTAAKDLLAALKAAMKVTAKAKASPFRFEVVETPEETAEDGTVTPASSETVLKVAHGKRGQPTKLSASQVALILNSRHEDALRAFADGEVDVEILAEMIPDEVPAEAEAETE